MSEWLEKPEGISWHEYLRGYGQMRWRRPGDEQRYHEVSGLLQPLYAATYGNIFDKTSPKQVIATKTPWPVQKEGHPPWTFKLQCLVTGRISRAIPYERYIEFGILSNDATTGGNFSRQAAEIVDRVEPAIKALEEKRQQYKPGWEGPGLPWMDRYDQYTKSEEWFSIRRLVLQRDNYRCQWTGKSSRPGDPLQIHHLTYERVGCEQLDDLITVCRSAHRAHHAKAT